MDNKELKKVNIIIGRFQPFSIGHLSMSKELKKQNGLPSIYVCIRSRSGKNTHLTDSLTKKILDDVTKDSKDIESNFFAETAFIPKVVSMCREKGYEPIGLGAGDDRYESYQKMVSKANEGAIHKDFKVIRLKGRLTSATDVRNYIKQDDKENFMKYTPKGVHKYYDEIRKELLNPVKKVIMEYKYNYNREINLLEVEDTLKQVSSKYDLFLEEKSLNELTNKLNEVKLGDFKKYNVKLVNEDNEFHKNLEFTLFNKKGYTEINVLLDENSRGIDLDIDNICFENLDTKTYDVFENVINVHNDSLKLSMSNVINRTLFYMNSDINESDLSDIEKPVIYFLSKTFDRDKLTKMNNMVLEMHGLQKTYMDKLDYAIMKLINTNRPLLWDDFKSCVIGSDFFKKEFKPFLMLQGLNDYQLERFCENLLKVKYQYYTNYFIGSPKLSVIK